VSALVVEDMRASISGKCATKNALFYRRRAKNLMAPPRSGQSVVLVGELDVLINFRDWDFDTDFRQATFMTARLTRSAKEELLFLKKKKQKDFAPGGVGPGIAYNRLQRRRL